MWVHNVFERCASSDGVGPVQICVRTSDTSRVTSLCTSFGSTKHTYEYTYVCICINDVHAIFDVVSEADDKSITMFPLPSVQTMEVFVGAL